MGGGAASPTGQRYPSELHFRSSGLGFLRLQGRDSATFNWQVTGDKLVIETPWINEKLHHLSEDFFEWRIGIYGGGVGFGNVTHRILKVSVDSIRLQRLPSGEECMLIRIPE